MLILASRWIKDRFQLSQYHPGHAVIIDSISFIMSSLVLYGFDLMLRRQVWFAFTILIASNLIYHRYPFAAVFMIISVVIVAKEAEWQGIETTKLKSGIGIGMALGAPLMISAIVFLKFKGKYVYFLDPNANWWQILSIMAFCTKTALIQELIIRGGIQAMMDKLLGPWKGLAALMIYWLAIHVVYNPMYSRMLYMIPIAVVGILLAFFYLRSRSINISIGFHIVATCTLGMILGFPLDS